MPQSNQKRFNLHLPGLLEVLAGSLYSTSKVGLRELIQNAHDSCVRRQVEQPNDDYQPEINIITNYKKEQLIISDNGHGLSAEDIETYLATIGRSYTGELKGELSLLDRNEASDLIGQFGFGFLSAFLIADEVTLITRSCQPNAEALAWHSMGGEHYTLEPTDKEESGTTVILRVKPGTGFIFNEEVLIETVQQFADFLPIPIHINHSPFPVNLMTPPWADTDPNRATQEYIARTFDQTEDPLCIIQLSDQRVDLGHDVIDLPLKGFLFVPGSSTASIREYGHLTVFIRRMFICNNQKNLLPQWAKFVQGVIDSSYLQPTASREHIHEDEAFFAIQQAIEKQLSDALRQIAEEEPTTWRRIVWGHSSVIVGWAARDPDFFSLVADLVPFRTSRGQLTLPEYLKFTQKTIFYTSRTLGTLQEQLLAEGNQQPVIDAKWFAVEPFLKKYAEWHPHLKLVNLDDDIQHLLKPVSDRFFTRIINFYQQRGIQPQLVSFKPHSVPALMIYPEDAEFLTEAQQAIDNQELPGPFANLVDDYLKHKPDTSDMKGTLYLNSSCELLQHLAAETIPEAPFEATLILVHQIARLFSGRMLTAKGASEAFATATQAIKALVQPQE